MKLLSAAIQCANSQTVRLIKILGLFFLTLFKVCYFLSVVLWSILSWSQSWVFVVQAFAYYYSGISRSTLIWMNGLQHLDVIPLKSPLPFDPGVTLWEYQCSWSQGCNQDRVKVKDKSKSEQFRDQVKTVVKGKKKKKHNGSHSISRAERKPTWSDRADHHRFLAARHEAETQDRVPSHLHQARGGRDPVQVNLLQGAALGHLAGKHRDRMSAVTKRSSSSESANSLTSAG